MGTLIYSEKIAAYILDTQNTAYIPGPASMPLKKVDIRSYLHRDSGGTGRRVGLRIQWNNIRAGSTPVSLIMIRYKKDNYYNTKVKSSFFFYWYYRCKEDLELKYPKNWPKVFL